MQSAGPRLFTIPDGIPFARALCTGVVAQAPDDPLALADTLILVPTRRATRALRDGFAACLNGAALLPKLVALGDVEEDFDAGESAVELDALPPVSPLRRRLLLANLVQHWGVARGCPFALQHALNSAAELGQFLDEAITQGADLSRLGDLAPGDFAAHWNEVISFLNIIAVQWPKILEAENAAETPAIRDRKLRALATKLDTSPPKAPVIAAGSTGSIPATAELLKTIAFLPQGAVVLPGLDMHLDDRAWRTLEETHPQFGLKRLLDQIGASRSDVQPWPALPDPYPERPQRVAFLSEALRPPPTTDAWRDFVSASKANAPLALKHLSVVEAQNSREEALAIACAMREALEIPGRTAALVTPDRRLARRVAAELTRWDIEIDDSAGVPLSSTAPGNFLSLLAQAAAERMSPVALLALLKHPLSAGGEEPGTFRRKTRALELGALRGLPPERGFEGIAHRLVSDKIQPGLRYWFADIRRLLEKFAVAIQQSDADLGELARLHAAAAEALAATASQSGAKRLWRDPAGESAASLMSELARDGAGIALHFARHYADAFRVLAEARAVRPNYNLHPRLAILGPLEARLLDFDLVILGGLNEGNWPAQTASDPWLSRPMRRALGLELPERRIGLSAHDFASLAASRHVLLTRSKKENGSPAVASRWLLRLEQLAGGMGSQPAQGSGADLLSWARQLDEAPRAKRAARPAPEPPVSARPRSLSVTEIEKWIRDPYAIYAKHVLRLKPLDVIEQEAGPAERGSVIHRALERFLIAFPDSLPRNAQDELLRTGRQAFVEMGAGPATLALWMPRFERAARWFVHYELDRRRKISRSFVEVKGSWRVKSAEGFELRGRADRIDLFEDGLAAILDYKSGRAPSRKQMENLFSPQLALEGAMLMTQAFGNIAASGLKEFVHIRLTGGEPPGEELSANLDANALAKKARDMLQRIVARYENPATPYVSWALRERVTDRGDYDHLARVLEWSAGGEEDE